MTEKDTLIFFTGIAERRMERRMKKSKVTAERLSQIYASQTTALTPSLIYRFLKSSRDRDLFIIEL